MESKIFNNGRITVSSGSLVFNDSEVIPIAEIKGFSVHWVFDRSEWTEWERFFTGLPKNDVRSLTGNKLQITLHLRSSLFKRTFIVDGFSRREVDQLFDKNSDPSQFGYDKDKEFLHKRFLVDSEMDRKKAGILSALTQAINVT